MLRWPALLAAFLCSTVGVGQYVTSPVSGDHRLLLEAAAADAPGLVSALPVRPGLVSLPTLDSIRKAHTSTWERNISERKLWRKLRNEHLLEVRKEDFYLNGDFVFDLTYGRDLAATERTTYNNTRGFEFEGAIGKRVFFRSTFYETQSIFPFYMDQVVKDRQSVPGMGRYKTYENFAGDTAYDYAFATGSAGIALNSHSFLHFGYDRQFIGYGRRSHLLSDASFPMPFLGFHLGFFNNKVRYSHNWSMLQGLDRIPLGPESNKEFPFTRQRYKYSYLSFQPVRFFEIGVFTAFLQPQWTDSNHVDAAWHYFVPVGGLSAALGDTYTNRLLGVNAGVLLWPFLRLYGQFAAARYPGNAALQAGIHLLDPFRWNHLSLRVEYNRSRINHNVLDSNLRDDFPGSTLPDDLLFTHNGQYLNHPLDGPFHELLLEGSLRLRDFIFRGTYMYYHFAPLETNRFAAIDHFIRAEAAYIVNPMSQAQVTVGTALRSSGVLSGTRQVYFGIRTGLFTRTSEF